MTLYSIPPLLTLVCFLSLAALAFFRGPKTRTNFLFFTICMLGSFLYFDILFAFNAKSAKTVLFISRTDHFFIVYLFPVYIHFFHVYLNIPGRKWLIKAAYVYAFILMCFTPTPLYIASVQKYYFGYFARGGILYPFFGIAGLTATLYVLIQIYQTIRTEPDLSRKNRLKYLFVGFGFMGLLNGLDVFTLYGYAVYPPGNLSFVPLLIFAVGLFKHDLLDMGILVRKSLIYSLLTAFLTCLYALLIIIADRIFKESGFSSSISFSIFFFLLIAFVFGPLKSKVQDVVDGIFYKGKYDYQQTIKHVSRMIVSVLDFEAIAKLLTETIVDAMHVTPCFLYIFSPSEQAFINLSNQRKAPGKEGCNILNEKSAVIRFMKKRGRPVVKRKLKEDMTESELHELRSDMDTLEAEIVLPMIFEQNLSGFITLGEKRSGDLFTKEDMDLLETLSSQSALAVENARSYKRIDDLNKDLEKKVEERTRSLKEALSEKERTQEQLIRSESLAAIGQLVAGVTHELNNPLTSATSLIQATIEDMDQWNTQNPPDEDLIEDLKFAERELFRTRSIVSSLLGLSRQTHTYSESVNINSVVKDALRVMHNQYKHYDVEIVENYAGDLPDIQGNFANLGQVALNVIQNAIQAVVNVKGTIFLATRFDMNTKQVVFSCKDTGPGISESIRKDIFKPFFTTKEVGEGTGLGLYICHEIVTKHGGTLKLKRLDEPGAEFEIRLPTGN